MLWKVENQLFVPQIFCGTIRVSLTLTNHKELRHE